MNKYQKIAILLSLVLGLLALSFTPAKAQVVTPNFPTCSNPQGILKVSYENGAHGIVGSSIEYTGRDEIYTVSDISLIQCFCSPDGNGIQTNWWKINSLTQGEIDTLKKLGWLFVPNGSIWGLDSSPYMAKNSDYACGPTSSGLGGQVLGASTATDPETGSVLGLATTGNSFLIFSLFILGSVSILLGKKLRPDIKHQSS